MPPCAIIAVAPGQHEVGELLAAFLVEDHRAGRDPHNQVSALMTILLFAAARLAVARDRARHVLEVEQRGQAFVDLEDHAAAAAAVAARRSAEGAELFAQKGDRAVAPLAGLRVNPCFINKAHSTGL